MTVKILAYNSNEYFGPLVEVSPRKILYEVLDSSKAVSRYLLPLPWIYLPFGSAGPMHILGSHEPITGPQSPLGAIPLLGSIKDRTCFAYVHFDSDLLTKVNQTLSSGGHSSYLYYLSDIPSYKYFIEEAKTLDNLYSYWESLETFPHQASLEHTRAAHYGYSEFLAEPKILVD